MIRIGINGFGRIGRMFLRRAMLVGYPEIEVVAVNDLEPLENLAYLFKHDSVHGEFPGEVEAEGHRLVVNGENILFYSEREPEKIPWRMLEVDVVIECTGRFDRRNEAARHLLGGARKVLISAPSKDDDLADITLVPGVNDSMYDSTCHTVVSMASCTTNSLAPVATVLHESFGIQYLNFDTTHAYTGSQALIDRPAKDPRDGRAAATNIIPADTGAARATVLVLPALKGKIYGEAIRVPVPDGSVTSITALVGTRPSRQDVYNKLDYAASASLRGILELKNGWVVSSDILGKSTSSIVEVRSIITLDHGLIRMRAWYDNEWGYACRLVEQAARMVPKE